MTEDEIIRYARENSRRGRRPDAGPGSEAPEIAWGDTFFFYDPTGTSAEAQKFPFATIVTKDYTGFDTASNLDRPGVFRLNMWVSKESFASLFGDHDAVDPTELDRLMPHPIYAAQSWVSVLDPGEESAEQAMALLCEAYERAVQRASRKAGRGDVG